MNAHPFTIACNTACRTEGTYCCKVQRFAKAALTHWGSARQSGEQSSNDILWATTQWDTLLQYMLQWSSAVGSMVGSISTKSKAVRSWLLSNQFREIHRRNLRCWQEFPNPLLLQNHQRLHTVLVDTGSTVCSIDSRSRQQAIWVSTH